jgi:hypothetical protein
MLFFELTEKAAASWQSSAGNGCQQHFQEAEEGIVLLEIIIPKHSRNNGPVESLSP